MSTMCIGQNLGSGSSPLKSLARQLLTLAFLARLKAKRIPIVRTVHNLERPSGLGRLQHRILDIFENQTAVRIRLNRHTPCPPGSAVRLIPHGHYIDWFSRFPAPQTVPGRIAFTGLVRRYKGVESLITAFRALRGPGLSLHVAGNPSSESISGEIRRLCGDDQRIHLSLEFQSEEDFAREIREAQLVVLPYKLMHNSGGTLAALSLQRPVLLPDNEINRELAREVGPGWVHLFSGELTAGICNARWMPLSRMPRPRRRTCRAAAGSTPAGRTCGPTSRPCTVSARPFRESRHERGPARCRHCGADLPPPRPASVDHPCTA